MRLFVALDIEECKDYLFGLQDIIKKQDINASFPKAFHITLKFLGEVDDYAGKIVKNKLRNVKFEKFELKLNKIGFFPSKDYMRIIWVGIEPSDKVMDLQRNIESALGSSVDSEYHPHITLARIKYVKDRKSFVNLMGKIKVEKRKISITNFKLINSILTADGPVYHELGKYL